VCVDNVKTFEKYFSSELGDLDPVGPLATSMNQRLQFAAQHISGL